MKTLSGAFFYARRAGNLRWVNVRRSVFTQFILCYKDIC